VETQEWICIQRTTYTKRYCWIWKNCERVTHSQVIKHSFFCFFYFLFSQLNFFFFSSLGYHLNIVPLRGVRYEDPIGLIMKYAKYGNLRNVIQGKTSIDINKYRLQFAFDIASGMEYLYSLNPPIHHCDLKPHNILVWKNIFSFLFYFFQLSHQILQQKRCIVLVVFVHRFVFTFFSFFYLILYFI